MVTAGLLFPFAPVPDVSLDGYRPTSVFWLATALTGVAFVLVASTLTFLLVRYRARHGEPAAYDHGSGPSGRVVTLSLAAVVFLGIDLQVVRRSSRDVSEWLTAYPSSPEALRVEIQPQQWAWNIRYPGGDGAFNTPDDVVTLNDLRVPVGRPVLINLMAKDVVHALYLPAFRFKQDAIPGRVTKAWFQARQTGLFEIACSQMCGWAHYQMRGELRVLTQADFDAWYAEAQGDAVRRFDDQDLEARWGWEWVP